MTTEYPLLDKMKQLRIPFTRENYIALDTWECRRSHGVVDPDVDEEFESTLPRNFGDKFFIKSRGCSFGKTQPQESPDDSCSI